MMDVKTTCDKCGGVLVFALGGTLYCPDCARDEARGLKPRTSPNELTVVVNIDASAAIAEVDALGEMITQRVKGAVAAGLAGETADLVRERDALREELAACKRERDEAKAALAEGVAFVADFKAQLRTTLECLAREEEV